MPDEEFEKLINGAEQIGKGTDRIVFAVQGRTDLVIKDSQLPLHHGNFTEWTVWHALEKMTQEVTDNVPNTELRHHFARCFAISHSARFLMMERLRPLQSGDPFQQFVATLPSWLNDKKPSALGRTAQAVSRCSTTARSIFTKC